MQISGNIDAGQVLISAITSCLVVIGWFIKRELGIIASRLDKHENLIFDLSSKVQRVLGMEQVWNGKDRRNEG
jgi:hypothetical protein